MKKPSDPTPQSEAERFVDFTRKLMSVPKEEIDEQQEIYEREKQPGQKREPIIIEET
jgi:hypothetical protein